MTDLETIIQEAIEQVRQGQFYTFPLRRAVEKAYQLGRKEATNPDTIHAKPGQGSKL